jgi:hypothetical protein
MGSTASAVSVGLGALAPEVTTWEPHGVGCLALAPEVTTWGPHGVGCLGGVPPVRPRPLACARSPGPRVPGGNDRCFIGAASALSVTSDREGSRGRTPVRGLRPAGVAGAHPAERRRLEALGYDKAHAPLAWPTAGRLLAWLMKTIEDVPEWLMSRLRRCPISQTCRCGRMDQLAESKATLRRTRGRVASCRRRV